MKKLFIIILLFNCIISFSVYSQWSQVGQVSNTGVYPRIRVVDSNIVWISSGYNLPPRIYRTVNGGLNWMSIPTIGLSDDYLVSIAAIDSLTAFVGNGGGQGIGGNAKLFRTTNAGLNWTLIDSTGGFAGFYNDIVFSKTLTQFGIALSDPPAGKGSAFYLNVTTNGGLNWTATHPPGIPNSYGVFYGAFAISPSFYGLVLHNTSLSTMNSYITSNGGINWYAGSDTSVGIGASSDIVFSDNEIVGIMITESYIPNIKRTTNGGTNWVTVNTMSDLGGFTTASWVSGTNTVFICANVSSSGNYIIRSDNGGLNWIGQNTSNVDNLMEIDNIRYGNNVYAYAVNNEGKILKSVQIVNPVGINQNGSEILSGYSLSQNYPNPFNPKTDIRYSLTFGSGLSAEGGENRFVSLKVYGVIGNEVKTLVDQKQNSGSYEVEFNGESLASGIYFYSLFVDGNLIDTKRMILLK